jgi:hypothetical protein
MFVLSSAYVIVNSFISNEMRLWCYQSYGKQPISSNRTLSRTVAAAHHSSLPSKQLTDYSAFLSSINPFEVQSTSPFTPIYPPHLIGLPFDLETFVRAKTTYRYLHPNQSLNTSLLILLRMSSLSFFFVSICEIFGSFFECRRVKLSDWWCVLCSFS